MSMRRSLHDAAAGHSTKLMGRVGWLAFGQKFDQVTLSAGQPSPSVPHWQVGAAARFLLTWKCRWLAVDQPVDPAFARFCPLVTVAPQVTPAASELPLRCRYVACVPSP